MRALHGLSRSLIANMVTGVTEGYGKTAGDRRRRLPGPGQGPQSGVLAGLQPPGDRSAAPEGSPSGSETPTRLGGRGDRQAAGGRSRRQHPQAPQARPVQGQGPAVLTASTSAARSGRLGSKTWLATRTKADAGTPTMRTSLRARRHLRGAQEGQRHAPAVPGWPSSGPPGTSSPSWSTTHGQHTLRPPLPWIPAIRTPSGDKTAKARQVGELLAAERARRSASRRRCSTGQATPTTAASPRSADGAREGGLKP